jgi:hypothetical protein
MSAKLRFFFAGVATTIAIIAAGFGGGALFARSASIQVRPARIRSSSGRAGGTLRSTRGV